METDQRARGVQADAETSEALPLWAGWGVGGQPAGLNHMQRKSGTWQVSYLEAAWLDGAGLSMSTHPPMAQWPLQGPHSAAQQHALSPCADSSVSAFS